MSKLLIPKLGLCKGVTFVVTVDHKFICDFIYRLTKATLELDSNLYAGGFQDVSNISSI